MNFLHVIMNESKPGLERRKAELPLNELRAMAKDAPPRPNFRDAFRGEGVHVIAELKKASPSKGLIREDFRPDELAAELERAGAAALSVLTEENRFLGSLRNLDVAAKTVRIPLLRKDFIYDEYQIHEAKLHGASAVLLIAAALEPNRLRILAESALEIGLDVLGEAHTEEEIGVLLESPATLIGVNARDLKTFECSPERVARLLRLIPPERLPIAESAIRGREDVAMLKKAGAVGFLVGEALMRAASPGAALREILA